MSQLAILLREPIRNTSLRFIIAILVIGTLSALLDIPVLRELLAVPFLLILPGLLLLFLLKLDKLGLAEKIILTVALSVTFLMFFGVALNQICLELGHSKPLSTNTFVPSLSIVLLALTIWAYRRNKQAFSSFPFRVELSNKSKLLLTIPAFLPLLSILGMRLLNTSNDNMLLITLLADLIPLSLILLVIFGRKISSDTYVLAIIMIGFALLSSTWLRAEHVLGHDVHSEYYLYHVTSLNGYWGSEYVNLLDPYAVQLSSCLSITILPATFQSFLDVSWEEYLFKGVYILICTLTPLAIFILARKYLGKLLAFLAAVFFMTQLEWMDTAAGPRTNLAIFFCAVTIMVLFHDRIGGISKKGLFTVFVASIIVSHYSTAYLFLFLLLFVFLASMIVKKHVIPRHITLVDIALIAVMTYLWHDVLTQGAFSGATNFMSRLASNMDNFFSADSRDADLGKAAGQGLEGPFDFIRLVVSYTALLFVATGILATLARRKNIVSIPKLSHLSPEPLQAKFEVEHLLFTLGCGALLAATVILPFVTEGYGMHRVYSTTAVGLSIFFIVGGIMLARFVHINSSLVVLLILIPYFLFVSGAIYELFGEHNVKNISSEHIDLQHMLVHDQDIQSAKWLSDNTENVSRIDTPDRYTRETLISQGLVPPIVVRFDKIPYHKEVLGHLYLNHYNVANGKMIWHGAVLPMTDFSETFESKNRIYVNGESEVWR